MVHIYAIIGIPLIFVLALVGSLLPPIVTRFRPKWRLTETMVFRFMNGFAGGVIIGVGFVHSFPDASDNLSQAVADGRLPNYAWAGFFALIGALLTFTVEVLLAAYLRWFNERAIKKENKRRRNNKNKQAQDGEPDSPSDDAAAATAGGAVVEQRELSQFSSPNCCELAAAEAAGAPAAAEAAKHQRELVDLHDEESSSECDGDDDDDAKEEARLRARKELRSKFLTEMLVLLAGLSFHSVFVGFTLGLTENDLGLFLAIVAHQFFEGVALGTRIARTKLKRSWLILLMDLIFALATPVGIAIGWGVQASINDNPDTYGIVDGVFNAISSGILLYIGLSHMMAEEMERPDVRRKFRMQVSIYLGVLAGSAVMAVIGIWA